MKKLPGTLRSFVLIALAVCLAAATLGVSGCGTNTNSASSSASDQKLPYDLQKEQTVDPKNQFEFSCNAGVDLNAYIKVGQTTGLGKNAVAVNDSAKLAQVYCDPGLTQAIPCDILVDSLNANEFSVTPQDLVAANGDVNIANATSDQESTQLSPSGQWGGFETFYLARYVGKDGKALKRPVVTPFKVKNQQFAIAPPDSVKFGLASNGGLNISWSPIKGATSYEVYLKQQVSGQRAGSIDTNSVKLIKLATTSKVSLNTQAVDANSDANNGTGANYGFVLNQNTQFQDIAAATEDAMASARADAAKGLQVYDQNLLGDFSTQNDAQAAIAVVALKDTSRSALRFTGIQSYLAQMPISQAVYAQIQHNDQRDKALGLTFGMHKLQQWDLMAVTMADGHTATVPIVFDVSKATIKQESGQSYVFLPYHGLNTSLGDEAYFPETPTWKSDVAAFQKTNLASTPKTGVLPQFAYEKLADWGKYKNPRTTDAKVSWPVNGSTAFVKFLASNLMAGNTYLDITAYVNQPGAPTPDDALQEAIAQNPYILYDNASISTMIQGNKTLALVTYPYTLKNWSTMQQQLWTKVQSVDKQIIKSGMDNEAKAHAIDNWLASNASYDEGAYAASTSLQASGGFNIATCAKYYDQYAFAQNATGVLLKGTGVCASYAAAFKALADQAGLPAMYVTGTVLSSGDGHAWNKVDLGGHWLIVDSTWDDAGSTSDQKFFGLKDTDKTADRVQDNDFVVDAYIGTYAS